jgi:UDP-N-acetyl-2-amino-2-deoxyglucuronate dehydrogenase
MINVAIVGTGSIADSHIEAYLAFPERCRLVAFVSRKRENAEAKAKKFSINVDIVDTYKELLYRKDIHLVSICTPPYTHAEMSIDFLQAGKNVIVEKPMAMSLEECDAMIGAAEENNKLLSVVAQNRFIDPIVKVRNILNEGLIGKVLHAQVDSYSWRGSNYFDLYWRGTWEKEGGGCTINQAIHHIDLLNWFMGMPDEITAVMGNAAHEKSELEDISISILKYNSGAIAQLAASIIHHGEERQIAFQGEKAKVAFPWKVCASKQKENGFPERDEEVEARIQNFFEGIPDLQYNKFKGQINDILTAIENGSDPMVNALDGRQAVEVVTAIYKSASLKKSVKLPISKEDPYYTLNGILNNVIHFNLKGEK